MMIPDEEPPGVRMMRESIEQNEADAKAIGCANWYCRTTSASHGFRLIRCDRGERLVALPLCRQCAMAVDQQQP